MKAPQFADLLTRLLRESGDSGIAEVDTYQVAPDIDNPLIRCADGTEIRLQVVRTSPPGGDRDDAEPVLRDQGTPIAVRWRDGGPPAS